MTDNQCPACVDGTCLECDGDGCTFCDNSGECPECDGNGTIEEEEQRAAVPAARSEVDVPRYPTTDAEYAALPVLRIDDFHQEQQ